MINLKKFKPAYKVTRSEDHVYTIDAGDRKVIVPGTTGILEIVGSADKTNRLMGWAKKQALLKVADHIREFSGKALTVDEAWIESVRKSAWKRDKEKLKEAGDIGTRVHSAIDAFIDGREPILADDTLPGYDNFLGWLKSSGITMTAGDTFVGSLAMGYGGAFDALGEIDGKPVLLDWKTSNSLHDENSLQAAAYAMAAGETFPGLEISRAFVVRFGKEKPGDVEFREVNLQQAKAAFISALDLHKKMKEQIWKEGI